ncbi:hypothetical protein MAFF301069_25770 [Ralstonia pseudosolanacearum]|nr:hypothetical protein MAFF301560_26080 [Ralstonia solanacearum]BEU46026.1 hypothetical protein MAFF211519_13510 [Ralstonia pseudosolanacearum]BEU68022.1 hypothetical protein MAFF301069_25770 [Ralstonia pseudosolanacearum]
MNAAAAIWMRTRPADGSLNTAGDPRRQREIVDIAGTGGHDGAASAEGGANANQNTEFSHCHLRVFLYAIALANTHRFARVSCLGFAKRPKLLQPIVRMQICHL